MNKGLEALRERLQEKYADLPDKLTQRLGSPRWRVFAIAINYLREIKVGGETAGVTFYSQLWHFGIIGRIGLLLLIVGLPVVGLSLTEQWQQVGVVNSVPLAALVAGLLLFSAGWAFILTVSMRAHLAIHCLACIYMFYYGLMPAMGYFFHPTFAIPIIWALYLIRCRVSEIALKSWWPLWIAPVCVLAGFLTFPAFGLHTLFEEPLKSWLKLLLGAVFFVLIAIRSPQFKTPAGSLGIFLVSWIALLATYLVAGIADVEALAESTVLGFQGSITFFSLFMMWLGISFFNGALGLGSWVAQEWFLLLPSAIAKWLTVLVWILAALFCWLTVHDVPLAIESAAYSLREFVGVDHWSYEWYLAIYGQFYLSIALTVIAAVLAFRNRLESRYLLLMSGLWVAGFFMLTGYYATSYNVAEFGKDRLDGSFWTLLLFIGGLTWSIIKSGFFWKVDGTDNSQGMNFKGLFCMVAMLLTMEGVTAVLLAAGDQQLVIETRLQPLLGITFIGVPYLCYSLYLQFTHHPPIPGARLVMLFALGCLSAFVCVGIDPYAGPQLILVPVIWLVVLLFQKHRLQQLASAREGSIAGMAMASGFITYWMLPMVIPIPFLEILYDWQGSYTLDPPVRPFMETGQFVLNLLALISAGALGFIVGSGRLNRLLSISVVIAAIVGLPVIAPLISGMSAPRAQAQGTLAAPTDEEAQPALPQHWQSFTWETQSINVSLPQGWLAVTQDSPVPALNLGYPHTDGFFQMFNLATPVGVQTISSNLLSSFEPAVVVEKSSLSEVSGREVMWISWSQMQAGVKWQALDALVQLEGSVARIQTVGLSSTIKERAYILERIVATLQPAGNASGR